jgi:biotin carboxylase
VAVNQPGDEGWFVCVEVQVRSSAARPEFGVGERLEAPGDAQLERARRRGLRTAVLVRSRAFYSSDLDWLVDRWIECDTENPQAIIAAVRSLDGTVAALTSSVGTFAGPSAVAACALGLRGPTPGTPALARDKATVHAALTSAGVPDVAWADAAAQEHVTGPLYSAEGFVEDGVPVVFAWSDRLLTPPPHVTVLGITATTSAPTPDAADFVRAVLAAVRYDFGAFHLQFVLSPGGPRLVELKPRLIGAGAHHCVDQATGLDTADHLVARLLGEPRGPSAEPPRGVAASTQMYLTSPVAGRVLAVSGVREVADIPGLLAAEVFADVGSPAAPPVSSSDHLGQVLTVGASPEQSRRRAATALRSIRVDVEEADDASSAVPRRPTRPTELEWTVCTSGWGRRRRRSAGRLRFVCAGG